MSRIDLIPRTIPIDDATRNRRAETVLRLAELGQLDPDDGEIATTRTAWFVSLPDGEAEVIDYAVSRPEDGAQVIVSLVLAVDRVGIGETGTDDQVTLTPIEERMRSIWGMPEPSPGEQAATDTQAVQA